MVSQTVRTPKKRPANGKSAAQDEKKLFVLDTNVLMHDPTSLFRFHEHDVYLPMMTLEELDGHKRGMTEVARNVRQVSRDLDQLAAKISNADPLAMANGLPLSGTGDLKAKGKLFFQTDLAGVKLPPGLPEGKADNQILGVTQALREREPSRNVILVTKDINMRIKARALGIPVEDYQNDKVLEDIDLLYTGSLQLPKNFWETQGAGLNTWTTSDKRTRYKVSGKICGQMHVNQFVFHENDGKTFYAVVRELSGDNAVLEVLTAHTSKEHAVMGIMARNREQNFGLNLLMNPEIDFLSMVGIAGTGKTLMTIAAGLAQVIYDQRYTDIIMTRATVPVGEDIGFLPGSEEEKMSPWMGALDDALEVLKSNPDMLIELHRAKPKGAASDPRLLTNLRDHIKIKSLNFVRGRSFLNKFVIVDEAQNLTPKQAKTLITRAGPGTKFVFLGNLKQIDSPYITEGSSGLTYVVDRFKGWPHQGHITLIDGERSRLAAFAEDVL